MDVEGEEERGVRQDLSDSSLSNLLDGVAFFGQEVSRRLGFGEIFMNAVWDTEIL